MSHPRRFSWDALLHAVIQGTRLLLSRALAIARESRVLHQTVCTYRTGKVRESVRRTRREDFKARAERAFHYFCSHTTGGNSVTGFHLTTRNAGKCSLSVCMGRKESGVGQTPSIVSATSTLNSELKYRMYVVKAVEMDWWYCVNQTTSQPTTNKLWAKS